MVLAFTSKMKLLLTTPYALNAFCYVLLEMVTRQKTPFLFYQIFMSAH